MEKFILVKRFPGRRRNVELAFLTIFEINNLEVKCQILFIKKQTVNNVGGKETFNKQGQHASSRENNPRLWMRSKLSLLDIS